MNIESEPPTQKQADKYILRFERSNHRAELKSQAACAKRSLNKHILFLIEQGEKFSNQPQGAQA